MAAASPAGRSAARRGEKPLLRGWCHAVAAAGAVVAPIALLVEPSVDPPRQIATLVFGLSMPPAASPRVRHPDPGRPTGGDRPIAELDLATCR